MNELMFFAVDCVNDCGGADILRILKFVFILIDLACYLIPIGLIIMIMIDFSKNVIAGKEDEMKKNVNMVIKRIIYCMVIFLVPTIVNFAVGLVSHTGDNIVAKSSECIRIAKEDDLSKCEVDYENLGNESTTEYKCYECMNTDIYVWSNTVPADDYKGCTTKYYASARDKSMCGNTTKKCWKCNDGTGYVLDDIMPSSGFVYKKENSFGYSSNACGAGFNSTPVDNCNCTTTGCISE